MNEFWPHNGGRGFDGHDNNWIGVRNESPKKKTSELPFFSSGATYIFKIAWNHLLKSTSRKDARTTKKSFVNRSYYRPHIDPTLDLLKGENKMRAI
jgi:hypothetical protein